MGGKGRHRNAILLERPDQSSRDSLARLPFLPCRRRRGSQRGGERPGREHVTQCQLAEVRVARARSGVPPERSWRLWPVRSILTRTTDRHKYEVGTSRLSARISGAHSIICIRCLTSEVERSRCSARYARPTTSTPSVSSVIPATEARCMGKDAGPRHSGLGLDVCRTLCYRVSRRSPEFHARLTASARFSTPIFS